MPHASVEGDAIDPSGRYPPAVVAFEPTACRSARRGLKHTRSPERRNMRTRLGREIGMLFRRHTNQEKSLRGLLASCSVNLAGR